MIYRYQRLLEIAIPLSLLLLIFGLLLEPFTSAGIVALIRGLLVALAIALNVAYITIQAEVNPKE